jgi:flagellar motor protein MotB
MMRPTLNARRAARLPAALLTLLAAPSAAHASGPPTPVNTTAPSVLGMPLAGHTLTAHPGAWSNTTSLSEYQYRWQRCDAFGGNCGDVYPYAHQSTYTLLPGDVGSTFRVAVGADGSVSTYSATSAVVELPDTTPPLAPTVTQAPGSPVAFTSATIAFTGAEPGGSFECRVDGGTWTTCVSPFTTGSLADGDHTIDVRQRDAAGNAGDPVSRTWTIDTTAPGVPSVTTRPANGTTQTDASFIFVGEPGGSFQASLDGGTFLAATSPLELSGLTLGSHTVKIRQTDPAGNVGATNTITWTIAAPPAASPAPVSSTPAVPTPAATTPAAAPAATTPAASPAPAATPAPAAVAPRFATAVGGTKVTVNAAKVAKVTVDVKPVAVDCQASGAALSACEVSLYTAVPVRGRAAAGVTRQVMVGTARTQSAAGAGQLGVKVALNASGRALLSKRPLGLDVRVDIAGTLTRGGGDLAMSAHTAFLPAHTALVLDSFQVGSSAVPTAAGFALKALAADLPTTTSVRIVGHTASGNDDARLNALGLARANAVKRALVAGGAQARFSVVTRGDASPRDTKNTAPGDDRNRRVVLEIDRR